MGHPDGTMGFLDEKFNCCCKAVSVCQGEQRSRKQRWLPNQLSKNLHYLYPVAADMRMLMAFRHHCCVQQSLF